MAYVLFALSALMIAFGIYSLVTGYPVVQVEEGWTAVISGSTFVAGGIVTAALGLVVRVLVQIRKELGAGRPAAAPAPEATAEDAPVSAQAEPPVAAPPPEPPLPSAIAPALAVAPAIAAVPLEAPVPPPPPKSKPPVAEAEPEKPTEPSRFDDDWLEQALVAPQGAATPIHDPGPPPEPEPDPVPEPDPEPEPAAPQPIKAREAPPAPPPLPLARPEPPPVPPEPELEAPPVAPDLEPEPGHDEHLDHEAPVASAKVIGRYEADGTSYVMYADGSIEAQTESGVYRFASMAELKSFIET